MAARCWARSVLVWWAIGHQSTAAEPRSLAGGSRSSHQRCSNRLPQRAFATYADSALKNGRRFANSDHLELANGFPFACSDHPGLPNRHQFAFPDHSRLTIVYLFASHDHPRLPNQRPLASHDRSKPENRRWLACLNRRQLMAGHELRQIRDFLIVTVN